MRKSLEIDNQKMKQEEKEKINDVKKNQIPFLFKELKRKNKKPNLFNYKENFKESNISRDLKKKTRPTNKSLSKEIKKKNKETSRLNKITADYSMNKRKQDKKNYKDVNKKPLNLSTNKMILLSKNKRK